MSQRPGAPLPIVLVSANWQVGCPQLQFMSLVVPTSAPVSVCPETGAASFLERHRPRVVDRPDHWTPAPRAR